MNLKSMKYTKINILMELIQEQNDLKIVCLVKKSSSQYDELIIQLDGTVEGYVQKENKIIDFSRIEEINEIFPKILFQIEQEEKTQ